MREKQVGISRESKKQLKTNTNVQNKQKRVSYLSKYTFQNISERIRKENISQSISEREAVDWKEKGQPQMKTVIYN